MIGINTGSRVPGLSGANNWFEQRIANGSSKGNLTAGESSLLNQEMAQFDSQLDPDQANGMSSQDKSSSGKRPRRSTTASTTCATTTWVQWARAAPTATPPTCTATCTGKSSRARPRRRPASSPRPLPGMSTSPRKVNRLFIAGRRLVVKP